MLLKRLFDIISSCIGLLILFPALILIAILIKTSMPGPVLFSQRRIGYGANPFLIYKFRSMKVNESNLSITLSSDDRITPLGHFLRKSKIDEMPQLWNILKGDMSIVGPRPDVPGYADKLQGEDRLLWTMRPGLTGLDSLTYPHEEQLLEAQTNPQKYYDEVLWPAKVKINVWYVKNRSFFLDIRIFLSTLFGRWRSIKVPGAKEL